MEESSKKENLIEEKSFQFALEIIKFYKVLKSNHEFTIGRQVLRAGTSIGANVAEGTAAQTRKDFITKMSIASKEARETLYWLKLLKVSQLVSYDFEPLLNSCGELIRILTAIVKTSQQSIKH